MAYTEDYTLEFTFAGKEIEAECEALPAETDMLIEDYIRNDDWGQARVGVVGAAVKKISIDGSVEYRGSTRKAKRNGADTSANRFPRLRDRESGDTLLERILTEIVTNHEWWLAQKDPFAEVFEDYRDEEISEKNSPAKNPTERPVQLRTEPEAQAE